MRATLSALVLAASLTATVAAQAVPQPFPKPGQKPVTPVPQPPTTTTPAEPGQPAGALDPNAPTEATLGVPIYPTAEFITSYDAGKGQRYYLFGTTASYAEMVQYYRNVLRQRGDQVFDQPAIHQFDIGRFREETMAFPPSVTIKDYTSGGKGGYLNPKRGATPARYPTIIQIVPNPPVVGR